MLLSRRVQVDETTTPEEIKEALNLLLYVPNDQIKPKIIKEYVKYFISKSNDEEHEITTFIARIDDVPSGIVTCHLHSSYTSYGRKCGAIGWLQARDFDTCKNLIGSCETFFKEKKVRKVRCGINFPKSLGGLGFQVKGFEEPMLYGVAFSSPEQKEVKYLLELGYFIESHYTCLRVSSKTWEKGRKIDDGVRFEYIPINKMEKMREEVQDLAKNSFQELLPDTYEGRYDEFIHAFMQMPKSKDIFNKNIELTDVSSNKTFLEAWESCDLEQITPLMPMVFDKKSGELVGLLLGLPDLYEYWSSKKITRVNVDTAIVRNGYKGRGIFSALNNIGQLTCSLYGMTYFEGTTVWTGNSRGVNNTDAINSIMPHCIPIKKHVILQKRLKK